MPAPEPGADADRPVRATSQPRFHVPLWAALLAMVAALVAAGLILWRVAGPLYGLLFPLEAPVPPGASEERHEKPERGAESWLYRTALTGNEIAAFYEGQGGSCRYAPLPGYVVDRSLPWGGPYAVATCTGKEEAAGLGVSWEVYIHTGYPDEAGQTMFRLYVYR
ncbi:MAG: hypothetical protein KBH93_00910 [Anaerolineae bacterium]|nr:hypothetical protein [Anaerolineae bacterium]